MFGTFSEQRYRYQPEDSSESTAPQAGEKVEDTVPGVVGIELGITAQREVVQNEALVAEQRERKFEEEADQWGKGGPYKNLSIQAHLFTRFFA